MSRLLHHRVSLSRLQAQVQALPLKTADRHDGVSFQARVHGEQMGSDGLSRSQPALLNRTHVEVAPALEQREHSAVSRGVLRMLVRILLHVAGARAEHLHVAIVKAELVVRERLGSS